MDQICFSYFYRGSPIDHFCQIVLSSHHLYQRRKCLKLSYITGAYGKVAKALVALLIDGSNFYIKSSSNHFYDIVLNSDYWFQRRRLK